jgi:uncharacterized repeat protein (TIGR01451 family)
MVRIPVTAAARPLYRGRGILSFSLTRKIFLPLLIAAFATIPLWRGLEHVGSASAAAPNPPASPTPSVTIAAPAQALIGTQVKFKVTFTNGTALGYGPFLDVVLDAGGANITKPPQTPPCSCDGITFVSAQMVGVNGGPIPLTASSALTAPCGGAPNPITHPFASNGVLPVTVPAGSQLITLALPFGSFQPNQPPIEVEITANVSLNADVGHALKISARGGFRFGTLTPLDDPSSDPPVFTDEVPLGTQVVNSPAWIAQAKITPTVLIINKAYLGPEGENATGPNFIGYYPLRYSLNVQVAPGQTVTNVVLTDCLPDNMAFHQLVSVTPAGTATLPPIDVASSSGCLTVHWNSLSGSATVIFEFFIPENDALGNPVLPADCTPAVSKDNLNITADWLPVDPCDGPLQHLSQGPVVDTLLDKCIAIQKSVAMFTDTGATGYTPGDTVKYTLNFQISDYKTFSALDVTDSLADGQQLVGPAPSLVVKDQFGTVSGAFVAGSDLVSSPDNSMHCGKATGGTKLTFLVSQKMINLVPPHPRHAAGILTGGFATTPSASIPATGQIIFYATIMDQFANTQQPGDIFVDKEDTISNCVVIGGKLMTNVNPPALPTSTGVDGHDDSGTTIRVVGDTLRKTVYAVKRANAIGVFNTVCGPSGITGLTNCSNSPGAPQEVWPGDQVTFRLEKTIPSTDAENLAIEDWLPLPTFTVSNAGTFTNSACGLPTPGNSCLGPSDQMHAFPLAPTLSVLTGTNGIKFNYGTFNDPNNTPRKIDLLFTYQVTNLPFADALFLTNEAQECETNTFGDSFCQVAIAQVNVRQPNLRIHKGVIATNNGFGQFTHQGPQTANLSLAQAPTGAAFSLMGGVSGTVNHAAVVAGLLDSNVWNVDANDIVTFAITIENLGGAPAYDVKIEDIIPTASSIPNFFTIVPSSILVKRGTGVTVLSPLYSISPPNPGSTNTSFTVTSTPNLPIPISAFNAANAVSGANIVTITFRAQLLPNVMPACRDNRVNLLHYSSTLNGPDFVAANLVPPFTDTANVCVRPDLTKSLVTTSEAHTLGTNVTIGEIARYRLAIQLPETAMLPNFQVIDALPAGLKFLNDNTARIAFVSNQSPITRTLLINPGHNLPGNSLPPSALLNAPAFVMPGIITGGAGCGSPVTFNLGNVKNNDNDPDREWIVIEFNAQVCNVLGNVNNAPLPNNFSVSVNNATIATSPTINLTVVEPNLTIAKAASPTTVVQGGTVAYTVTITNTSPTQAFDLQFTDTLPAGLNFVSGSTTVTGACVLAATSSTAPAATCGSVAGGGVVTIKYNATANPVSCPATLTNQAAVTWTSLRGPKGTAINPTMSITTAVLGASGTVNGERDGITTPLALNDYAASTSKAVTVNCPPCTPPPQGMSAWWPFDEPNGTTVVNDIAGVINNQGAPKPGSPVGATNAPGAVAGRVGGAFKFDSAGASTGPNIEVPDHPEIKFGSANFSIDAWVFVPQPPAIYIHPIVDKLQLNPAGNAGTGYALNLVSSFTNGARLQFLMGTGGPLVSYGPNAPSVLFNTWTHVTVTVDRGSGVVTFYINGSPLPVSGPAPSGSLDNTLPLLIGESRLLGLGQQAISIDELEFFKRVLPQSEIQSIVNAGGGGKCKCLRASNEVITCGANGTFNYTFTVTNLSSTTATAVNFAASAGLTITPSSMTIPPLAPGGSTNVTVTIGGAAAVSGANICFSVGLSGPPPSQACRVQHCITLPACQASACATPPAHMVAWWPLNETSGNVVHSIVGNHDGTTLPGPIGSSGPLVASAPKVGSALFFGAAKAEVPDDPALNFGTGNFSVDAWVRSYQSSLLSAVVDKLDTTGAVPRGYAFFVQNGKVQLVMADGATTTTYQSSNTFVANGTWRHVAVTVRRSASGSYAGQFYIDGLPAGPSFTPLAGNIDSNAKLLIGNYRLATGACSCEVSLDEIEIFNEEVPASDILAIFNAGPLGKCRSGSLTVNKTITSLPGLTPPSTAVFPVTVSCQPSGYNQVVNLTPSLLTQTFNNIPVGDTCTVTEGPLPVPFGNPVCAALGWSPPVYTPSQTVAITGAAQSVMIFNRFGCTTSCAARPAGMVGWWPMNVQANQVNDIAFPPDSVFNNVGNASAYQTVNGVVSGFGFGALYFTGGAADLVTVPSQPELNFVNGDFSVDAWISIVPGGPTYIHPIVDKFNSPGGPGFAFYVRNQRLELNLNGATFVSTGPPMTQATNPQGNSGPWYHVAVTVKRNPAQVIFYLNGGQVGSYSPTASGPIVNTLPLWIGGTRISGGRLELAIDELELFNRVVTQAEIQQIFSAGAAGKCR